MPKKGMETHARLLACFLILQGGVDEEESS
jgi:hypothetical protein